MYEGFYQLKENPFRLSPDPTFMCMTLQHREALAGLIYTVRTNAGLTVLLGEAGTGKTTLLYSLLGVLEKSRCCIAMCTNPTLTRQEFYDLLMLKLGVDCQSSLKSRQLASLEEALRRNRADGRRSILIVDEAQRLSPELLEEVRLLMNLETPREKLLEIIISGQPELDDVLNRPDLRQLKQRISCICRLKPLTLEGIREYIDHRIARAGLPSQKLFSNASIDLIYLHTQGIPRLVNSLCNSALQNGFALQSQQITPSIVEDAAKDLDLTRATILSKVPAVDGPAAFAASAPAPSPVLAPASGHNGKSGSAATDSRMPLESYESRQKSFSFLAGLMQRWK